MALGNTSLKHCQQSKHNVIINYNIACTIELLRPLFTVCERPGVRNRGQCQRAEKGSGQYCTCTPPHTINLP